MIKRLKLLLVIGSSLLALKSSANSAAHIFKILPVSQLTASKVMAGPPVADFTANDSIICAGDTVKFTDLSTNVPTSWSWSFPGGVPATSTLQNPVVFYGTPGTYSVKLVVTNGAGSDSMTKVNYIVVTAIPVITITGTDSICLHSSTTLTANGAANYSWAPSSGLSCTTCPSPMANPTVTTVYTIIGNTNGCSNATTYTVYVLPLPSVQACSFQTICTGVPVVLSASGSPNGGTYTWQPGNKGGKSIVDTPSVTTTYTVSYSNSCGIATDTVTVFVSPIPILELFANFKSGCTPLCVLFQAVNSTPAAKITSWSWDFGDGGSSNNQNQPYCYEKPGTYSVTMFVQTTAGCTSTTQMANPMVVYELPKANFTYTPDPVTILDPLVNFTDISSDPYPITSRLWSFGDGSDSTSDSRFPSHNYTDTGIYCPSLIIGDIHGCMDTITKCFDINNQYSFYIPNSFSPNGDNVNDVFMPKGTDVSAFEMYIYDRWGMQLYQTNNILDGWNGKVKNSGKTCQEDVYVYIITVTDNKGSQHHFTGAVYLVK